MSRVITSPTSLPTTFEKPSVFLAGSIDRGTAEHWQAKFIAACEKDDLILLNPRRDHWPSSIDQQVDDPVFRDQIEWEQQGLERANIVAMYLSPESSAPISMLELGLNARSGKLIVACPDGFWRKGNVKLVCQRYKVPFVNDLDQLIQTVRARATQLKPAIDSLYAGRFLKLVKEGHWEYAERTNATGAAVIIAVTPEQKLLLVEQYRIPVHARTIELPAGIIGDEPGSSDEAHAEAARRELIEETGYEAAEMETLTHSPTSSGLTSETVTIFHARNLRRVGPGGGVAHENITVHEVPLADIHSWLQAKANEGALIDSKVYTGLYFIGRSK